MSALVIKPKQRWQLVDLLDIWHFRELFYIFAWRDLKVRYKQTLLGATWAIFQPLFSMAIFTLFFGNLAKIPSGNLPYPLFVLIGLIFWGFFANSMTHASNSLIDNENIIKKVYFPRIVLPISSVVTGLVDFAISLLLLMAVSFYFGIFPDFIGMLVTLPGMVIAVLGASGLGLLLSAVNVRYRDVRYILPFFVQMVIFLTPVIYPLNLVRPTNRLLMALNPMTGVIESVRNVYSSLPIDWGILLVSFLSSVALFLAGLAYFRSTERHFADIV